MAISLNTLPPEDALCVLKRLSEKDLCAVSQTCQALRAIGKDSSLWKSLLERKFLSPPSEVKDLKAFSAKNIDLIRDYDVLCVGPTQELFQRVLARAVLRSQMRLVGHLIEKHSEMFSALDQKRKLIDPSAKTAHRDLIRWAASYAASEMKDMRDVSELLPGIMQSKQMDAFWLSVAHSLI